MLLARSAARAAAIQQLPAKRAPRKPRRRLNWDDHARECVEEGTFTRMYRMNLNCFNKLPSILRPLLERDVIFGDMRGGAVSVESRVAIALSILAGASYVDLLQQHDVHRRIVYDCLWSIVDAINASDSVGPFCFPGGVEECRKLAADFKDKSEKGCMDRVVGAIDGLFVEIDAPSTSECLDQLSYYSGAKKGYGINAQAIATANYRFSCVTVLHPGSTNDFCAYLRSDLPESTAALPRGFHIVRDAAYPLSEKLLTPYVGKGLGEEYDVSNFHLSRLRIKVEQSFGNFVEANSLRPRRACCHHRILVPFPQFSSRRKYGTFSTRRGGHMLASATSVAGGR